MNNDQTQARNPFMRFLNGLFVFMGILFLIQLIALVYIWFADPFEIRQFFEPTTGVIVDDSNLEAGSKATSGSTGTTGSTGSPGTVADPNPLLSAEQEAQLKAIGVNPASLPSKITPEMEACFRSVLGNERTDAIAGGAQPTPVDFFKARGCL